MTGWKTWTYVFLIIGGISLIVAIIAGLILNSTVIGITSRGYIGFTQTCFLLAANFGILQLLSAKESGK